MEASSEMLSGQSFACDRPAENSTRTRATARSAFEGGEYFAVVW